MDRKCIDGVYMDLTAEEQAARDAMIAAEPEQTEST